MKKISIIIPVWNEEKTVEKTIQAFKKLKFPSLEKEIILVNDGSTDKSPEILDNYLNDKEIKVLHNKKNMGKSQSVRKGVLSSSGDIVVVQDADLEYDPEDLIPMADIILRDEADVIYGNRYDKSLGNKAKLSNYWGNKFLTIMSNFFTMFRGMIVPDMEVCQKMQRGNVARDIAKDIKSTSKFGIEPEITARISKYKLNGKKLRVKIYPVKYFPRAIEEGKKMRYVRDGLKAFFEIIRYNVFE